MIVTPEFDKLVNTFTSLISSTEWSGPLFFKEEVIKGVIHITPVYILLQDIGTPTYTEYNGEDSAKTLAEFYAKNPDFVQYNRGKIHSHNSMPVFFSGEDMADLGSNSDEDGYLSLIVNNAGEYCAKIGYGIQELATERTTTVFFKNKMYPMKEVVQEQVLLAADVKIELPARKDKVYLDVLNQIKRVKNAKSSKDQQFTRRTVQYWD